MKKNTVLSVMVLSLALQACGPKTSEHSQSSSALNGQLPIIGGSVTKEIIIRTNAMNSSPSQIISGNIVDSNNYSISSQSDLIKKINAEKANGLASLRESQSGIKKEYKIDLATGTVAGVAGLLLNPPAALAVGLTMAVGGSALKGFVADKRQSAYEEGLTKLNDRRERDVLKLAMAISDQHKDSVFDDIHAGIAPSVIKEKILKFQGEIIENSDLSPADVRTIVENANDNLLLGFAMDAKENQKTMRLDIKNISKELNKNQKLLEEIAANTETFIKKQNEVFEFLNKKFNPDERELLMNALFDPSNKSGVDSFLKNPDQLDFFKSHPQRLGEFKAFLKNNDNETLMTLVKTQEKAQIYFSYLQVSAQIANNLNIDPDIGAALNKGATVASATSSIASFMISSNPMDALNALSSISTLFSKPKPDPRFTAIFENFKQIKNSLREIQLELNIIEGRIDNVDDGLSYIISQNELTNKMLQQMSLEGMSDCSMINDRLSIDSKNLNYNYILDSYKGSFQGEDSKVNNCINYMLKAFENPFRQKNSLFSADLNNEAISNDPEFKKVFTLANQSKTIYSTLLGIGSAPLKGDEYKANNLLSVSSVVENSKQLLSDSFLFDVARVNSHSQWELVPANELSETIKKNGKSNLLLENALKLAEISIVQQSVIDGNIEDNDLLKSFLYKDIGACSEIGYSDVKCLGDINPVLMNNYILKSFRKYIDYEFFWSWSQIAKTNPDWINSILKPTSLKVVWVGAGASDLFTGERLPQSNLYSDGPYVQVRGSKKLFHFPVLEEMKPGAGLILSQRVSMLKGLKEQIENEIIERKIDMILNPSELAEFNNIKIKNVLP